MSERQSNQNLFIAAIIALLIAGVVLGVLYIQTRTRLGDEQMAVATAAAESTNAISSLEDAGTEVALVATEAFETAIAEFDNLSANSTEMAEQAASDATSAAATAAAELDALSADATESANAASAQQESMAATATEAASSADATIDDLEAQGTAAAESATSMAATFTADLANMEAESTEAAADARAVIIDLEAQGVEIAAGATEAVATLQSVSVSATEVVGTAVAQAEGISARATINAELTASDATAGAENIAELQARVDELTSNMADAEATASAQAAIINEQLAEIEALQNNNAGSMSGSIEQALTAAGISMDGLQLAESRQTYMLDLSGQDEIVLSEPFSDTYTDFVVAATISWDEGAAEDYCGFSFRRIDGDNYYTAEIDRFGEARFYVRANGEWSLGSARTTADIKIDSDQTNDLLLIVRGDTFDLYINGVESLSLTDTQNRQAGQVGLMAGTFDESDAAGCTFTDAAVWEFTSASATTEDAETSLDIIASRTEDGAFILGNPDAPVTVVEFADFTCPHCQAYRGTIDQFIASYVETGKAKIEFRMFPAVDQQAFTFRAMECAVGDDPSLFWQYHDVMYEVAESVSSIDQIPDAFATRLELNTEALAECMQTANQHEIDAQVGINAGVRGTPSIRVRYADGPLEVISPELSGGGVPIEILSVVVDAAQ